MSMSAEWPEAEQRIAEVARTRRGRHRNKALASYRRTRALELRAQGLGYAEIAREVGYANKGTAHKVIAQALEAREANGVEYLRDFEVARLNALQAALWDRAMAGDVGAAHECLKLITARCRLLGLYEECKQTPNDGWDNCQGPTTLVARPDDCRHAGCDRHGRFDEQALVPVTRDGDGT